MVEVSNTIFYMFLKELVILNMKFPLNQLKKYGQILDYVQWINNRHIFLYDIVGNVTMAS